MPAEASRVRRKRTRSHLGLDTYMGRLLVLRTFGQFDQLAPEQLSAVAEHTSERFFAAGSELYSENQPVSHLHYIVSGKVELRRNGVLVYEVGERSVVGGLAALAYISDGQQAIAVEDTVTLAIPGPEQLTVFAENFGTLAVVLGRIAAGLLEARRGTGPDAGFDPVAADAAACPVQPVDSLTVVDRLIHVRRSFSLPGSHLEGLMQLAEHAREHRAKAGTTLWRTGDRATSWLLVVAGIITGHNDSQRFGFGPGSIAGSLGTLADVPRWYTATAETDIIVLEMSSDHVLDILEDNVDMAIALLRGLGTLLLRTRDRAAQKQAE